MQIGCVKLTNKEDMEKAMSLNSTELNDEIVEISLGRPTISRRKRAMLPRSFTGHNRKFIFGSSEQNFDLTLSITKMINFINCQKYYSCIYYKINHSS